MESLIKSLLADSFGVSRRNLKTLLQIFEDECGENEADKLEAEIESVEINGCQRFLIPA